MAKRKNTTRKARKARKLPVLPAGPKGWKITKVPRGTGAVANYMPPLSQLSRAYIELQKAACDESARQLKIEKAVRAAMPKPHPSIVFGPEAAKDSLTLPPYGNPDARYIWP